MRYLLIGAAVSALALWFDKMGQFINWAAGLSLVYLLIVAVDRIGRHWLRQRRALEQKHWEREVSR